MNSVLTVCVGNICRSPMAEAILSNSLPSLSVASAGVGALVGQAADPMSQTLMRERNIDISNHVARQLNQDMCRKADLILVMDRRQRLYVEDTYPFTRGKVFLLLDNVAQSIPDPYKKQRDVFEQALAMIDEGANTWAERIKKITHKEERQFT